MQRGLAVDVLDVEQFGESAGEWRERNRQFENVLDENRAGGLWAQAGADEAGGDVFADDPNFGFFT